MSGETFIQFGGDLSLWWKQWLLWGYFVLTQLNSLEILVIFLEIFSNIPWNLHVTFPKIFYEYPQKSFGTFPVIFFSIPQNLREHSQESF